MPETKRCPYCAEEIQLAAIKCKHCGEWLSEKPESVSQKPKSTEAFVAEKVPQTEQSIQTILESPSGPLPEDIFSSRRQREDKKLRWSGLSDNSGTRWNVSAIVGLCLGIASAFLYGIEALPFLSSAFLYAIGVLPILAIIFGVIGLVKIKEYRGIGKVQAGIGLVLGIIFTCVYVVEHRDYIQTVIYQTSSSESEDLKVLLSRAEGGDVTAQAYLGYNYEVGKGVEQDSSKAAEWYQKAAEQGNAVAQYNLAVLYHDGRGVGKDYAEAMKWYLAAAEQGDVDSQHNIGVMYYKGEGVTQDHTEAMKWFLAAAQQGYADSQYNIGVMYEYGRGVPQDDEKAVEWYRKAAALGNIDAGEAQARIETKKNNR